MDKIKVLFVCMGNICRSPTAHGVFQQLVSQSNLDEFILIDSAGTHDYHIGKSPDKRATAAAAKRDYDLSRLRARHVTSSDFQEFDYVLAMDNENYSDLVAQCDARDENKISLFLQHATRSKVNEVPDPYYGGAHGFETVLDLVEDASAGFLQFLITTHNLDIE